MNPRKLPRLARPVRDFLVGLALFGIVAGTGVIPLAPAGTGWISSTAHARLLEAEPAGTPYISILAVPTRVEAADAARQQMHETTALVSLALAFSVMFAFNLWFFRHLRQVRATYRRR